MTFDGISSAQLATETNRLSSDRDLEKALREGGFDESRIAEAVAFLDQVPVDFESNAYLDKFFAPNSGAPRQTRFSDGVLTVYYSALDVPTILAEIKHWVLKRIAVHKAQRLYYRVVRCQFAGSVIDLVGRAEEFPCLVADDGYDECNEWAREAKAMNIDAFRTQSARLSNGICLPVFSRAALGYATVGERYSFTIDTGTNSVVAASVPG